MVRAFRCVSSCRLRWTRPKYFPTVTSQCRFLCSRTLGKMVAVLRTVKPVSELQKGFPLDRTLRRSSPRRRILPPTRIRYREKRS
jgi:hypothetical protein